MTQATIAHLARTAANEAVDSLLTVIDADSIAYEQLEADLAAWLIDRLQQAREIAA
jgi:hypothetical protein